MLLIFLLVCFVVYLFVREDDFEETMATLVCGMVLFCMMTILLSVIIMLSPLHVEHTTVYSISGFSTTTTGKLAFMLNNGSIHIHESGTFKPIDINGPRIVENKGYHSAIALIPWVYNDIEHEVYFNTVYMDPPIPIVKTPKIQIKLASNS